MSAAVGVLEREIANARDEWGKLTDQINTKQRQKAVLVEELERLGMAQSRAWFTKTQAERALAILR